MEMENKDVVEKRRLRKYWVKILFIVGSHIIQQMIYYLTKYNKEGPTVQGLDLVTMVKEAWRNPEISAGSAMLRQEVRLYAGDYGKGLCFRPQVFPRHPLHVSTETGAPIPSDACPINCVVSNFVICGAEKEDCSPGASCPSRIGDCIVFTVKYKVRVWFEFFDNASGIWKWAWPVSALRGVGCSGRRYWPGLHLV